MSTGPLKGGWVVGVLPFTDISKNSECASDSYFFRVLCQTRKFGFVRSTRTLVLESCPPRDRGQDESREIARLVCVGHPTRFAYHFGVLVKQDLYMYW